VSANAPGSASAKWVRDDLPWHRAPDRHCTLCGRLLIRSYLAMDANVFCDEDCEELYRTYWLPRHGPASA
jgi:hypothetical protein